VFRSCSPARAALLTGQINHNNGMFGLSHVAPDLIDIGGWRLREPKHHLLFTLRDAGYLTALAGVEHIVDLSEQSESTIGHDIHLGNHDAAEVAAAKFLDGHPREPFFLTVGFHETHRLFPELGPGERPDYTMPPAPLPDTPVTRADFAGFKASARIVDTKMGVVFEALRRNGYYENTLIIATTDHGIPFPRMKGNLTDGGTGVFLILRGPGGFSGGRALDALVHQLDIFPTVCNLAGMATPDWVQGKSLMPLVRGEVAEVHNCIFTELTYHRAYEPSRAVRTKRYKYIRRFDLGNRGDCNADPNSPSTFFWRDLGWNDEVPEAERLYDLAFDPQEMRNLVGQPRYRAIHEELRVRLQKWMEETNDPLLSGPIPGPDGTFQHDRDKKTKP
jgi:arylsulfatase A-like enzyme